MGKNLYNIQKLKDSKSFCIAPWITAHTYPSGDIFPCCLYNTDPADYKDTDPLKPPFGNVNRDELKTTWNSDKYKEMRLQMLDGKKPVGCTRCYHLEKNDGDSYRKKFRRDFEHKYEIVNQTQEDGTLEDMKLYMWDFRISNFCNLKCRSCGPDLSSAWFQDYMKLFPEDTERRALININDKASFMDMIESQYEYVEEIYFAGGEPLVMPEHWYMLEKLIQMDKTDTLIRYSTNFSKLKFAKKHIFDYWKKFDNLDLYLSVDGVDEIGEYVRKGFISNQFIQNVKDFLNSDVGYRQFGYMVTYGSLNFLHLFDIVLKFFNEGILDKERHEKQITMAFSPITQPNYYNCQHLPNWAKNKFKLRLAGFRDELEKIDVSSEVCDMIMRDLQNAYDRAIETPFNLEQMKVLKSSTEKLDVIRKERFEDVFYYYDGIDSLLRNN
tara:strand:- start:2899 stop:4215 length:1317 start_codon:yes stop_codon:yes gene_type:complete